MLTINLMDLSDYSYTDMYSCIMACNETSFRITMPKICIAPKDHSIEIATDYYDALYFGQVLSVFSHDFCYTVPSEYSDSPFAWEFHTTELEQLADTLYYLIKGIVLDAETDHIMKKYWDDKALFWNQYCNNEIEPVCQGLLKIMEKNLQD
jgi:hypothetical protein